ncbi:MAG: stage III sporulation protein D [Clostridia bacterium]|nr:stage III sporulation protein D [Clostridia bacterium]
MRDYMIKRALMNAEYILETRATVRDCAERFGTSKSTVHKDVTERLKDIDHALYLKVKSVLEFNLSERHLRGGVATREKYLRQKEEKSAH